MTAREFVAAVPRALDGVRVDRAVAMLTGVSRSEAAALVAAGHVSIDRLPVRSRRMALTEGGQLVVELPGRPPLEPDAAVPFRVVHEDPVFVVVDKPAGVVVHPGAGRREGTLVAGLLARYPELADLGEVCDPTRPGIVHRIDRGTSGLLVVARTIGAYRSLGAQMGARSAGRTYVGLVSGRLKEDRGVVDAPIGRSVRAPTKMTVSSAGRPARTGYEVLQRVDEVVGPEGPMPLPATLVACRLETGRTHQIRVHLAAIGHPVLGDDRYGRPTSVMAPGRLFLHAAVLAIDHPETGVRMSWRSPLPDDLAAVLGTARSPWAEP